MTTSRHDVRQRDFIPVAVIRVSTSSTIVTDQSGDPYAVEQNSKNLESALSGRQTTSTCRAECTQQLHDDESTTHLIIDQAVCKHTGNRATAALDSLR